MAGPEVVINSSAEDGVATDDVDMEILEEAAETGEDGQGYETELGNIEPEIPERVGFIDYLKSPIVELLVGSGDEQTTLSAHQALLAQSPFLREQIEALPNDTTNRRIDLQGEDLKATASVIEWLYKQDYFPNLSGTQAVEHDPSIPSPDDSGVGLLRHARVYTLAQRFRLPTLASQAHRKIHLTKSTAQGEIAYARYVYGNTETDDDKIRKPIAQFWATRSHVLRHEAEAEFRNMCLQFPQFGFDVLSLVLDAQEKRTARSEGSLGNSAGQRKRARLSQV